MLASHYFDPVVGVDIHIVLVPTPPTGAPVPTPVPMMHAGWVWDPAGLAVGMAISSAVGAGVGVVRVNRLPATNCLTEATQALLMPHVPVPGVAFGTGMPGNDAHLMFGATNKRFGGSYVVRLGELAMPCSDPVRLPTGVVISIPLGRPVIVNALPAPDLQSIAMATILRGVFRGVGALVRRLGRFGRSLWRLFRQMQRSSRRWRAVATQLHLLIAQYAPRRLQSFLHRSVCTVTGHPVDVANGRMFTNPVVDLELPGPLPLRISRIYDSSLSWRRTSLGWGWSHSLDQAVWTERGKVVLRAEDGREIEFATHDLPGRELAIDHELRHPLDRLTLRRTGPSTWSVRAIGGVTGDFAQVPGSGAQAKLVRIRDPHGNSIDLHYARDGRLAWVRDSAGRRVRFEHDAHGQLVRLWAPRGLGEGDQLERRYAYDARGDLTSVTDAAGHSWRFEYVGHLLVKETDRVGVSFFFQYDGHGPSAKCVRTWGRSHDANGLFDHEIAYDTRARRTTVTDSLGAVRVYEMNELGMVVAETDPHGARTAREYDGDCGRVRKETDALGRAAELSYDPRGNVVAARGRDGSTVRIEYVEDRPVRAIDAIGGTWSWRYDSRGDVVETTNPLGETTRFTYRRDGLPETVTAAGRTATFTYDDAKNLASYVLPNGSRTGIRCDRRGAAIESTDARGLVTRLLRDELGRVVRTESHAGVQTLVYDAESNVLETDGPSGRVRMRYGHFHALVEREQGGATTRFEHDTEDQVRAVIDEAGQRFEYELDRCGRVSRQTDYAGRVRSFARDALGRVTHELTPGGRRRTYTYDAADRIVRVDHLDGTFAELEHRADGALLAARNQHTWVRFHRDALGRVVREETAHATVSSRYDGVGRQGVESTLGARAVYLRDEVGEVASVFLGDAASEPTLTLERDHAGAEIARALPGGLRVEWSRDAIGRPSTRRTSRNRSTILDERHYAWRNPESIASIVGTSLGRVDYVHDGRGRLVEERSDVAGLVVRAMDDANNVYRTRDRSDRAYLAGGQLASADGWTFVHDDDGNLVERRGPGGATWTYRWNDDGTLREVERPDGLRVRGVYDPLGRRVAKQLVAIERPDPRSRAVVERVESERVFVWDGSHVLHELEGGRVLTRYEDWASLAPIALDDGNGLLAVVTDHLGTPTDAFTSTGDRAWTLQLDCFGRVVRGDERSTTYRFQGQYHDVETGLFYNRHRYYDPALGRYISQDPLGLLGGLALYAYVLDPTTWGDPFGLAGCTFPGTHAMTWFDTHTALVRYALGKPTLGPSNGDLLWAMPAIDVADVRATGEVAFATGFAPGATDAWLHGDPVYCLLFPADGLPFRRAIRPDAKRWPHWMPGGHTAVRMFDRFFQQPVREFVLPGGGPIPQGSRLIEMTPDGFTDIVRRF